MTEVIDQAGRWILTHEDCRHCGRFSKYEHPAGVVSGRWHCSGCGHRQDDPIVANAEEFKRSRKEVEE